MHVSKTCIVMHACTYVGTCQARLNRMQIDVRIQSTLSFAAQKLCRVLQDFLFFKGCTRQRLMSTHIAVICHKIKMIDVDTHQTPK